jgi:hypothetical protein
LAAALNWTDYVAALAAAVAAVGTVGAVLVALFLQPWLERRRRPNLRLAFAPTAQRFVLMSQAEGPLETATMRVSADVGRKSAEDVEVLLTSTMGLEGEVPRPFPEHDHRPLAWVASTSIAGSVTRMHLPPASLVTWRS